MRPASNHVRHVAGNAEIAAALLLATTLLEHAARPGAELAELARLTARAVRVLRRLRVSDEQLDASPAMPRFESAQRAASEALGRLARGLYDPRDEP